ncbi:Geranylgeranyl pyrophosphate synthase [Dinochytrium kinnereticum]|nr:Geranylgeranyl pyrophosphate synthase [Dinochytrium kinnereticum]
MIRFGKDDTDKADAQKIILEPFYYLCQQKGKEIRTKLMEAFGYWMKVPEEQLKIICDVVEMLHTASLLIDDVQDDSALRRGIPVAHKIYGVASVINSANYVYFVALQRAMALNDTHIVEIFTEELLQLHRGQGMELYWRDFGVCPTEDEYIEMVRNKTGGLLRLAVRLMQLCSNSTTNYIQLVDLIGIHYQIRDDYLNLVADQYAQNKGFAEDLTEGKFSYLIMHCIKASVNDNQLASILRQRTTDLDVKKYAIRLMEKTKTFEATISKLKEIEETARAEIARLGGNPLLERVVDYLSADYKKIDQL